MIHTERPLLDVLDLPETAYSAEDWPIAAGLPRFPGALPDGTSVDNVSAETWQKLVKPLVDEGYDCVEIPSSWIRLADMSPERRNEFRDALAAEGLTIPGLSVARRSIIEPGRETANLDFHHRTIDAAAQLDVPYVGVGLHQSLTKAQEESLWFWTAPGPRKPDDRETYERAVRGFQELGRHAANVGVQLSLELYEDTYLGSADEAVRLVEDIGLVNVGINADFGNLLRLNRPIDSWEYMAHSVLPYTNYWHIKNYSRMEDYSSGNIVTIPTSLELGTIDYRKAVRFALSFGFDGPLVVEHYGGDGIAVGAANREYLRRVLP